jgi:SAM-dependent methyltransferase
MPETVKECPLCASNRSSSFDKRLFHGIEVVNRRCLNCGLVYQSPRMTEAEIASFYVKEYRLLQEGSADPTARNLVIQKARAGSLVDFVSDTIPAVSNHLDIGSSLGILLQQFQAYYHSKPLGIEPGESHRLYARNEGLVVYASIEELEINRQASFDLISLSHVLEHLPNPTAYLDSLRKSLLKPDGWLLLEVPNLYAHDSFEVAHLFAFSPHTLREVIYRSGFEIIKFEKHGRPNSTILPLYLTALCRPAPQLGIRPVRPERCVTLKRRMGMLRRHILEHLFPARVWLKR